MLRGLLLTGDAPTYMRASLVEGEPEDSTVAEDALWWPPSKITGRYLSADPGRAHKVVEVAEGDEARGMLPVEVRFGSEVARAAGAASH